MLEKESDAELSVHIVLEVGGVVLRVRRRRVYRPEVCAETRSQTFVIVDHEGLST